MTDHTPLTELLDAMRAFAASSVGNPTQCKRTLDLRRSVDTLAAEVEALLASRSAKTEREARAQHYADRLGGYSAQWLTDAQVEHLVNGDLDEQALDDCGFTPAQRNRDRVWRRR